MMNEFIFEGVLNGDLDTIIDDVEYSTRPRDVVTVGQMVDEFRKKNPFLYLLTFGLTINGLTHLMKPTKIKQSSYYGSPKSYGLNVKGMIIDEYV